MRQQDHAFLDCKGPQGGAIAFTLAGAGPRKAIFFHGHPGSRHQVQFLEPFCAEAGLEVLSFDRPGYGNSSPLPAGSSPLDLSATIAALAGNRGWDQFHLIAVSGGAPYALKVASLLGGRVQSVSLVCGLGPLHEKEIRAHFPRHLYLALQGAHWLPNPVLNRIVRSRVDALLAKGREEKRPGFLSPGDFTLLQSTAVKASLRLSLSAAFRQGVVGAKRDIQAYLGPWELAWQRIQCPVSLWHGLDDRMVPWQFSEILAKRLPEARFIPCEGEGHYTLPIQRAGEILKAIPNFR